MSIYTLTGDDGTTSLSGGKRVSKHSPRVEAYGSVDELIAWMGMLRGQPGAGTESFLIYLQDQLMFCAAGLASDEVPAIKLPSEDCVTLVEKEIDKMEAILPPLKNFILPGGHPAVSACNIARCVCRRAERSVLRLKEVEYVPEITCKFLNRLSDYLFLLSRTISESAGIKEVKWPINKL